MCILGDLDQVLDSTFELVAGHRGDDDGVELSSQLAHVLLAAVHHALHTNGKVNSQQSRPEALTGFPLYIFNNLKGLLYFP